MATTTTNFGLRKPAGSDLVNVTTDISDNMDLIDDHAHSGTYVPVGWLVSAVKAANETLTASTVLQNDDDLLFAIAANETWTFSGLLDMTSPNAADMKMAFTVPAGATLLWYAVAPPTGVNATTFSTHWVPTTTSGAEQAIGALGANHIAVPFQGSVINGATAGTVNLQWAQNTSDAGTLTIFAGSFLTARRVA